MNKTHKNFFRGGKRLIGLPLQKFDFQEDTPKIVEKSVLVKRRQNSIEMSRETKLKDQLLQKQSDKSLTKTYFPFPPFR